MRIFAIDPGNEQSGYVVVECLNNRVNKILKAGKINNYELLLILYSEMSADVKPVLVIELIESFGMPVGRTVFETCIWIGRFLQYATDTAGMDIKHFYITRREEKLAVCKSPKAKDSNIRQALIDKYATFDFKNGKGTKKQPDFFYGFKADMWAAFAVADTFLQLHVKDGTKEYE